MQEQFERASRQRRAEMLGVDLQVLLKTERDLAARRLIDHHKQQHATVPAPAIIAIIIIIIIIIMMINPSLSFIISFIIIHNDDQSFAH